MPQFDGSKPGPGRPKGSKNKKRYDVGAKLEAAGVDLVADILKDLADPDMKPGERIQYRLQLLRYIAPTLKSTEVIQETPTEMKITFMAPETRTADEIAQENGQTADDGMPPE